jgi:hypothetical protein
MCTHVLFCCRQNVLLVTLENSLTLLGALRVRNATLVPTAEKGSVAVLVALCRASTARQARTQIPWAWNHAVAVP